MQPIVRFLHIEAAGGILLLVATVVALVWANSPWDASYDTLWHTVIRIDVGSYTFEEDLGHVVNDLLMAVFFFVVGMEIKRELVAGELRDRRAVALPAMAALGGMVVPALIYLAFNASGDGVDGWGIPMATDIAFALGVVALLGSRVPAAVKVLLLTLAIVDDIGAILVIAVFYTDQRRVLVPDHRCRRSPLVVVVDAPLPHHLRTGDRARRVRAVADDLRVGRARHDRRCRDGSAHAGASRCSPELEADEFAERARGRMTTSPPRTSGATANVIGGSVSPCDRLIDVLHPWTSYLIVPIFALANAGIADLRRLAVVPVVGARRRRGGAGGRQVRRRHARSAGSP